MDNPSTTRTAQATADGAIDLMAKLAVLIVAALLFACYGIREARTQPIDTVAQAAAQQARAERVALLRRGAKAERAGVAMPAQRQAPPATAEQF